MTTLFIVFFTAVYLGLSLWRLPWMVALLPVFFPLYLIKGEFFGIPFTLVEALVYAVTFAFLLQYFFRRKQYSLVFSKNVLLAAVVVVLGAVVSFVAVPFEMALVDGTMFASLRVALGIFKGWIVMPLLYFVVMMAVLRGHEQLRWAVQSYVVSAVGLGLWAWYQMLTGDFITLDARASGPFVSANYLALYIGPALFYAMTRLFELLGSGEGAWWQRIFGGSLKVDITEASLLVSAVLVLLVAMVGTKSYAAILALGFGFLLFGGFQLLKLDVKRWRFFSWKLAVVLLLVVAAGVLMVFLDPVKWQAFFELQERSSSSVRLQVYTIALQLLGENWLTGIGMGQFEALYQVEAVRILGREPYEWVMLHPHNLYVAVWLNLGLLGFVAFISVIVLSVRKIWHKASFLQLQGASMLGIILAHGMFDTPFFKNDLSLLWWLVVAIIFLAYDD